MYVLRYLWYIIKHKIYVYEFGKRLKIPFMQLILHDLSKFSRAEFMPYAVWFYNRSENPDIREIENLEFQSACQHHLDNNRHHYNSPLNKATLYKNGEVIKEDTGGISLYFADIEEIIVIGNTFIKEMIADWLAMEYAKSGNIDMSEWLTDHVDDFKKFDSNTYNMFTFYMGQTGNMKAVTPEGQIVYVYDESIGSVFLGKEHKHTEYFIKE